MSRKTQSRGYLIPQEVIERKIFFIRGRKVMLDHDLALIYGVETRNLVQAVKRNRDRFPTDFVFQLTSEEYRRLRSQFVISKGRGGRRYRPYAFTEHGTVMAANILNSHKASVMSVYVVRAFIKLHKVLAGNKELAKKLTLLERKLSARLNVHEAAIVRLFTEIREHLDPQSAEPEKFRRRIGFHR